MRKYVICLSVFFLAFLIHNGEAHAFAKGTDQDCGKCHTLNAEEAQGALKAIAPDVKILEIQPGPLKGFWELGIEAGGRKNIVYLDFSKKKIIVGNVIDLQTRTNYTKESFDRINKVDLSQIPLENSLVMGDKDAKYKIVVFDDPE
jgi:thiol:disulfide interchange protein DsbC